VRERLQDADGALVFTRNFWVRVNNAKQDLVVVQDIAEEDSYRIDEIPMPRPVIVDVGAHIGCFAKRVHQRNPLARIVAVECCPENVPVLRKNTSGFAEIVQAAVTYEEDVALMNAVYPDCVTTGGSIVAPRETIRSRLAAGELTEQSDQRGESEYWADLRSMETVTLEDLMTRFRLPRIDVLKLDCEGSEFSILGETPSLDRIGLVVGEYHGRERFHRLVSERFAAWELRILREGELGTFWLANPARAPSPWE
jgi:FkbM family methyltransferase